MVACDTCIFGKIDFHLPALPQVEKIVPAQLQLYQFKSYQKQAKLDSSTCFATRGGLTIVHGNVITAILSQIYGGIVPQLIGNLNLMT